MRTYVCLLFLRFSDIGPFYFFAKLLKVPTADPDVERGDSGGVVQHSSNGGTLFRDASGHRWPNGSFCVTDECIDRTIERFNHDGLFTSLDVGDDDHRVSAVGRQTLFFLPLLVPIGMGMAALLSVLGSRRWKTAPRYLSACVVFTSFLLVPVGLAIIGGVLFPGAMVFGDACRGLPNLGNQYVQGSTRYLCEVRLAGTLLPDESCRVPLNGNSSHIPRIDEEESVCAIRYDGRRT